MDTIQLLTDLIRAIDLSAVVFSVGWTSPHMTSVRVSLRRATWPLDNNIDVSVDVLTTGYWLNQLWTYCPDTIMSEVERLFDDVDDMSR